MSSKYSIILLIVIRNVTVIQLSDQHNNQFSIRLTIQIAMCLFSALTRFKVYLETSNQFINSMHLDMHAFNSWHMIWQGQLQRSKGLL